MTADRPDRCNYPLLIGSTWVHTCKARFMEPVEPARPLRLVRAAS